MRRAVGVAGLQKQAKAREQYKDMGVAMSNAQLEQMKQQLEKFAEQLKAFASKYRHEIKKNAEFRSQFQRMCSTVGVDPLASNKGFWTDILGIGDFYYEIAIQITEVCLSTRSQNGGYISVEELRQRTMKSREQDISEDDIIRAIKSLQPLGTGFEMLKVNGKTFVNSVPRELNTDHVKVLEVAQENNGSIDANKLIQTLNWEQNHAQLVLEKCILENICWIDDQSSEPTYWVFGIWMEKKNKQ